LGKQLRLRKTIKRDTGNNWWGRKGVEAMFDSKRTKRKIREKGERALL